MNSARAAVVLGILAWPLVVQTALGQKMAGEMHEHQTHVSCDDVPPGQGRPEFGCFNIATESGLQFQQPEVYWHIRTFANRTAAEAAKSATGIVVEEDGRVWLSEFGARNVVVKGGHPVAVVGPLKLLPAKSYTAVLSFAAMRPGDRSRVHTHPGPEGWYMIAGEQCLETPAGANRAKAGGTMTVPAERSNGAERHGYSAPKITGPGDPRFFSAAGCSFAMETNREHVASDSETPCSGSGPVRRERASQTAPHACVVAVLEVTGVKSVYTSNRALRFPSQVKVVSNDLGRRPVFRSGCLTSNCQEGT